jgi:hypothetical protein
MHFGVSIIGFNNMKCLQMTVFLCVIIIRNDISNDQKTTQYNDKKSKVEGLTGTK